ncbi:MULTISPECIES: hypothetical protein [Kitasatospora]|uniref:Uncharacterized protein n=1 Tax=Kitasatospora cathayae TaxID=3004092 RepID=A0ABY7Q646_9ACTN|nr:hypothetical protein [Kitasatospora sp. HUAS 3-15]WBP88109.1 hypothetical protein O1G21_21265 [Kitasatospora sp. HUAS 3-15]
MTKRTAGSTAKFRQGTQDLLERRGMVSTPSRLGPKPLAGVVSSAAANPSGDAFRHGGRDAASSVVPSAPAMHAELKGHRHRGAEKHSVH